MPKPPPLFAQSKSDNCTLACFRMILAQYGIAVTEERLEAQVEKEPGGVHIDNLAKLIELYPFTAQIVQLELDAIESLIVRGVFPIAYVNRVYFGKRTPLSRAYATQHTATRLSPSGNGLYRRDGTAADTLSLIHISEPTRPY